MRDLSKERWQQVDELFAAALEEPVAARERFLAASCQGDPELRRRVALLLAAEAAAEVRLGESALDFAAPLLPGLDLDRTPPADSDLAPGTMIGAHRVLGVIGRGGMGTVYLAERSDGQFQRRVALKLVQPGLDHREILRRFRAEREILASLEHPHIARLYEAGATPEGRPYLILEYVDGQPIDAYCDARRLPIDERLRLFVQACEAVQFAHGNLIVHRDLKPSNIFVARDGSVKLLDFGIAKALSADESATLTRTPAWTPAYASPEQVRGAAVTFASDIYSLGVVLYELLTGASPHPHLASGPGTPALSSPLSEKPPEPPSRKAAACSDQAALARNTTPRALARRLSGDLDAIVQLALAKDPRARFASVAQFAADIQQHLDGGIVSAHAEPLQSRLRKLGRRQGGWLVAGLLGLAAAVATSLFATGGLLRATAFVAFAVGVGLAAALFLHAERTSRASRRYQALAELHRRKAERVSTFLREMLGSIHPDVARGRDTSLLEDLLRGAARRIDVELAGEPAVAAELHRTIGSTYRSIALYDQAAIHLQEAGRLESPQGSSDGWVQTQIQLAELDAVLGRHTAGLALLAAAEASAVELEPQLRAQLMLVRGRLLDTNGDLAAAEAAFRSALRHALATQAGQNLEVARTWLALGTFLTFYNRRDEGETALREAVRLASRPDGHAGPLLLAALSSLGTNLVITRRFEEAAAIYDELVPSAKRFLGEDHVELATHLTGLARLHEGKGDFAAAEPLYRRAIEIRERAFGPHHRDVGTAWNNLAHLYLRSGRYGESDPCYRKAISTYEAALGSDHPWVAFARENHALVLLEQGEAVAAEAVLRWALALPPERYERIAHFVPVCEYLLGACRADQGAKDEARDLLRRHDATLVAAYGEGHPVVKAGRRRRALLEGSPRRDP